MVIVGINDAHDSSVCVLKDGKVVAAAMEERFQRIKAISTFPKAAIEHCLRQAGLTHKDVDHVAFATQKIVPTNVHNVMGTFSVADHQRLNLEYYKPLLYENRLRRLTDVFPNYKAAGEIAYPLDQIPFATTAELDGAALQSIQDIRRKFAADFFDIDPDQVSFYDHHACHAYHAYFVSPLRDGVTAVVTSDGGGDSTYESVWRVEDGQFELLHRGRTSLIGKIYASVTLLMGMDPNRHPYKVMGLAPYATDYHKRVPRDIFLDAQGVDGLGFSRNPDMKDFYVYFQDKLRASRFDGIAGGLQDFVEIRLAEWFENIANAAGTRRFAYGGGVANNTKANLSLMARGIAKSLFIPAGPGDEGLAVGAAFHAYTDRKNDSAMAITRPANAYLGADVDQQGVEEFANHPFIREHYDRVSENTPAEAVADILATGEIVALCRGGMEFGARALGHRSFICDPSNQQALRRLNDLIKKRDFWMPFAPSVLEERFDDYMIKPDAIAAWSDVPADYMTLCFETTELGRRHMAAAIHVYDFTARPQRVADDVCPRYRALIKAFEEKTGIGAVLNTSLNIHEKPIVLRPVDIAEEILVDGGVPLNYILVDDTLFARKNGV